GYYTPTSVGTDLSINKEVKKIDGIEYVLEKPIKGDVALIRGYKADTLGNIVYYKTARNFNPLMATAAKYVVAEEDEIVNPGELEPELIATPQVYIDAIVPAKIILKKEGVITK